MIPVLKQKGVGVVTSEDRIVAEDGTIHEQEGLYVKYEMFLRMHESELGILSGASGSCYCTHSSLIKKVPGYVTRDLFLPIYCRTKGLRTVNQKDAICYIKAQSHSRGELTRKVRTITGGIDTLLERPSIFNPFKYGSFAMALISHKLIRLLGWFGLIGVYILSFIKMDEPFYLALLVAQTLLYLLFALQLNDIINIRNKYFQIIFFFLLSNLAAMIAWFNYMRGKHFVTWEPTKR